MNKLFQETSLFLRVIVSDRPSMQTAFWLLLAVVILILTYCLSIQVRSEYWLADRVSREIWFGRDRHMGEIVNYGLAFFASVLFFLSFLENRSWLLLFFAILMAFIWFDDSTMYHERLGLVFSRSFDVPTAFGLKEKDVAELVALAAVACVLGFLLFLGLINRNAGDGGVFVLVCMGLSFIPASGLVSRAVGYLVGGRTSVVVGIFEDGGQMLATVLVAAVALGLSRNGKVYYELANQIEK